MCYKLLRCKNKTHLTLIRIIVPNPRVEVVPSKPRPPARYHRVGDQLEADVVEELGVVVCEQRAVNAFAVLDSVEPAVCRGAVEVPAAPSVQRQQVQARARYGCT